MEGGQQKLEQLSVRIDTVDRVPASIQVGGRELGLRVGPETSVSTANGIATAYLTRLDQLGIGGIEMLDVDATIIDNMGDNEVLLGMNVLKHFELVQRGDRLIIRQYH